MVDIDWRIEMKKWFVVSLMIGVLILSSCATEVPGDNLNEQVTVNVEGAQESEQPIEEVKEQSVEEPTVEEKDERSEDRPAAVDFTMTSWQGEEITLSGYEGKIVFLNFFATWCPPCQEEMPLFQQAYEDYEGDVVFQIIDVYASERDGYQNVIDWYTDGGYTMPMIIDEEDVLSEFYPVRAFPTTFVIDREGNVLGYLEGGMNREMVDSIIAQADL